MRLSFNPLVCSLMVLVSGLSLSLVWSAESQGNTNAPALATGDQPNRVDAAQKRTVLTFGLDQIPALQREYPAGIPVWQYLASLIYIFLAFLVSKFLDIVTRVYLRNWTERTKTQFDDLVLSILKGPIKITVFVILLHIGLQVFAWPEVIEKTLSKALIVVVAASITYMIVKLVDLLLTYWRRRAAIEPDRSFDDQLFPVIRKTLQVFIIVVAVLLTSQNLGLNITSLIASLSIGGLALGLAAQDTLGNIFGAVSVFVDKPFRIGDRIKLDAIDGVVESIGLRSTRIRNLDGHLITVPNKTVGSATITNITLRPNIKTIMNIGITYDTRTEKVKEALSILEEIYKSHPMTFDVWISFNQFADSSLNMMVVHWWNSTDYKAYLLGMQEMNLAVKERFDQAGISFAFPTRTLYLKQDSEWKVTGRANGGAG